jgi:hypothetical protein
LVLMELRLHQVERVLRGRRIRCNCGRRGSLRAAAMSSHA